MDRRYVGTIQPHHLGETILRFDGCTCQRCNHQCGGEVIHLQSFMGRVQVCDIGKRIYSVGGIYQVENQEQVETRMRARS